MSDEKRITELHSAICKHLKIDEEDLLNFGYINESPTSSKQVYGCLVAVRVEGQPVRGRRVIVDPADIGEKPKRAKKTGG